LSQSINRTQYLEYKQDQSLDLSSRSFQNKEEEEELQENLNEEKNTVLPVEEEEKQEKSIEESFEEPVEEERIAPSQLNRLFEDSIMSKKNVNTRNLFDSSIICESDLNETGAIVCIDETKLSPSCKSSSSSSLASLNDIGNPDTNKDHSDKEANQDEFAIHDDEVVLGDEVERVDEVADDDDDNDDADNEDELEMNIIDANSKSNTEESGNSHHSIESNEHSVNLLNKTDEENENSLNLEKRDQSQRSQRSVQMKSDEDDDEIVIEDEILSAECNQTSQLSLNSKKRKSIDIIQLDEQSYHLDDSELPNLDNYDKNTSKLDVIYENYDQERNKKPKLDTNASKQSVEDDDLCLIEEYACNTSAKAKSYESQSQISFSQKDHVDKNQVEVQVDAQLETQFDCDPLGDFSFLYIC